MALSRDPSGCSRDQHELWPLCSLPRWLVFLLFFYLIILPYFSVLFFLFTSLFISYIHKTLGSNLSSFIELYINAEKYTDHKSAHWISGMNIPMQTVLDRKRDITRIQANLSCPLFWITISSPLKRIIILTSTALPVFKSRNGIKPCVFRFAPITFHWTSLCVMSICLFLPCNDPFIHIIEFILFFMDIWIVSSLGPVTMNGTADVLIHVFWLKDMTYFWIFT